jgi:hypothetical protein
LPLARPNYGFGLTAESTGLWDLSTPNIRLFITLDVAYDRFAYVAHKLGEQPVFLLTGFQFAFQFCVIGLPWFPERGLGLGGRHLNSASYGSSRATTRFDVSVPHFVH